MGKICSACGEVKPVTEFHACRKNQDGLLGQCKDCALEYGRRYREAHPGKEAERKKRYRSANPERDSQYYLAHRESCGEKKRERARISYRLNSEKEKLRKSVFFQNNKAAANKRRRAWALANPDKVAIYGKRRTEKHSKKLAEKARLYRSTHVEETKAATKRYRTENRDLFNALYMKRYAQKKKAMPSWVDMDAILAFYTEARELTRSTGTIWHVDHIVPLQHKLVCGLHVAHNLQLLPAKENRVKSNSLAHLQSA